MNAIREFLLSPLAERLGWGLLHFLWEGAVIAALLAVALRVLRNRSPNARYLAGWVALLAMACAVPLSAWLTTASPTSTPRAIEEATASAEPPAGTLMKLTEPAQIDFVQDRPQHEQQEAILPPTTDLAAPPAAESRSAAEAGLAVRASLALRPALPWAVGGWLAGTLVLAFWHLGGWWQLGRLRRAGTREAPAPAQQMLAGLLRRFALRAPVKLLVSARVAVPTLIGWLRPVILLPASVLAELPPQHLELILAHELAHLRRCDYLLNLVQTAIETLLFYHPAVWWVSRQIRVERESCCDEQAAAAAGDRLAYARALASLAELCRQPPRLASSGLALGADGGSLSARVRRVLRVPVRDKAASPAWLGGGLAALVLIAAMAGAMAWAGNQAGKAADGKAVADRAASPQQKPPAAVKQAPETPRSEPTVDVSGQVVDDATGRPVGPFVVQAGRVDDKDPAKITWGYSESRTNSPNPQGRFSAQIQWGGGWRARILAAGYLPQPILDKAPAAGVTQIREHVVRLKRGREIAGRVLYHDGSPAADASVFLLGERSVLITAGKAWQKGGLEPVDEDRAVTRTTTDSTGRFRLSGGGGDAKTIAVSAPRLDVWALPAPEAGAKNTDFTIKLPQPGRLVVHYDIAGGTAEAKLLLELHSWDTPGWRGLQNMRQPHVANHGQIVLDNLPPGKYELTRQKSGTWGGFLCDRRSVTIESGKTVTSDFVRRRGTPIQGRIAGVKEGMFAEMFPHNSKPGALVIVRPAEATGDPRALDEWKLTLFDVLSCGLDGKFQTERLPPGKYAVVAESYLAETPEESISTGVRLPAFVGRVEVTVPEDGPPPQVTVELRPRAKPDGGESETEPAGGSTGRGNAAAPAKPPPGELAAAVAGAAGKPAAPLAFGPVKDGVQAAAEISADEPFQVRFHIRNASRQTVTIAGNGVRQDAECVIDDQQGRRVKAEETIPWFTCEMRRDKVSPGGETVFSNGGLSFLPRRDCWDYPSYTAEAKPGRYTVRFRLHFPWEPFPDKPDPQDWKGDLETAPVTIEVQEPSVAGQKLLANKLAEIQKLEAELASLPSKKGLTEAQRATATWDLEAKLRSLKGNAESVRALIQKIRTEKGTSPRSPSPEAPAKPPAAKPDPPASQPAENSTVGTGQWHRLATGELAAVDVERTPYEKEGQRHFFIHVRITNLANRRVGIDLSNYWKVIYPNQWGMEDADHRTLIDERRMVYKDLDEAAREALVAAFRAGGLTVIPPGKSIDYYREFNASGRADVDRQTKQGKYLIVSLDGVLRLTDGKAVEQVSCAWGRKTEAETDVVIPTAIPWRAIPSVGRIVAQRADTLPALTEYHSERFGLTLKVPKGWIEVGGAGDRSRVLAWAEPGPWRDRVQTKIELRVEDAAGNAALSSTDTAGSSATVSKRITVDGVPARVTGYRLPPDNKVELLTLQVAKNRRFYTASLVFASDRREFYLALADAVFQSLRLEVAGDAKQSPGDPQPGAKPAGAAAATPCVVKEGRVVSVNGTKMNWPDLEKLKWTDVKDPKSVDPRFVALGQLHVDPRIAATHTLRVHRYFAIGEYMLLCGWFQPPFPDGGFCWVVNTKDMKYMGHFLDKDAR